VPRLGKKRLRRLGQNLLCALSFHAFQTQFGGGFFRRFGDYFDFKSSRSQPGIAKGTAVVEDTKGIILWVKNVFRTLPTRNDLRKHWLWECRRLVAHEREKHASQERIRLLRRLWKASWYSIIQIRVSERGKNVRESRRWNPAFAVLEGHRFLWWNSTDAFDNGKAPAGKIFLSGHSGLTGPSPAECRELRGDEISRVSGIFGRGSNGQERVIMLIPELEAKNEFEDVVRKLTSKDA
jgi:hypothetical protein